MIIFSDKNATKLFHLVTVNTSKNTSSFFKT